LTLNTFVTDHTLSIPNWVHIPAGMGTRRQWPRPRC